MYMRPALFWNFMQCRMVIHWSSRLGVGLMGQHPITREKKHMLKNLDKNGRRKITQNSIEMDAETKRA